MTTALDRIEAGGYAQRVWDQQDRRSVRVVMTDAARKKIEALYGPLAKEGFQLLQKYITQELAAVLRYPKRAGPCSARTEDSPQR